MWPLINLKSRTSRSRAVALASRAAIEPLEGRMLLSGSVVMLPGGLPDYWSMIGGISQHVSQMHHHKHGAAAGGHALVNEAPNLLNQTAFVLTPGGSSQGAGATPGAIQDPTPTADSVTPAQLRQAYGFNFALPGGGVATGAGQTIAIVDAFHDPNIQSDLHTFDQQYFGGVDPSFTQITLGTVSGGSWDTEESIDVEWAHAMAPQANIILVEAASNSFTNLLAAVDKAVSLGAQVVSMSWGGADFSTEASSDSHYSAPGVTFIACSGDYGSPEWYPAASPNVLGVGGTSVELDANNNMANEVGWSDARGYSSGGGISAYESRPAYQPSTYSNGTTSGLSLTGRGVPDVSYDADADNGIAIYDSYGGVGWERAGGTSCGAPQWAAIVALADQVRAQSGQGLLGTAQVLSTLYANPGDFRDIVSGASNGSPTYSAGTGYDLVTGLGSPMVPSVITSLTGNAASAPAVPPGVWAIPGDGEAFLNWGGSLGVTSYNVYRSTDGVNYSLDTTVSSTYFADTGLTDGASYSYRVTAVNALGESAASVSTSVVPQVPPAAPTQLRATPSTSLNLVTLQWAASPGAADYVVKRTTGPANPWVAIASGVASTTFTDHDAYNGHTYYYCVAAETSAGQESTNSSAASATIIPSAPASLAATAGDKQVSLSWTASVGATSYNILRSTTNGGGYLVIASGVTATSYTVTGLTDGTTYYFVLQAVNVSGASANSNQVSATPKHGK
jgi:fibronectin type 3 domain-containing protein